MNVPGRDQESQQPHGGKWGTIKYAIGTWGTTVRLSIVLLVLSVPTYPLIIWLIHR
jgi:hypothetical protein